MNQHQQSETTPPSEEPWHPIFVSLLITGTVVGAGSLESDELTWFLLNLFWFLTSLPSWSPFFAAAILLAGYRFWLHPKHGATISRKPRILAAISLIPTVPISLIAGAAVPWFVGLLQRLDNDRWQQEILLALIALIAVVISLPSLICRANGKRWSKAGIVWFPVIGAYSLVGCFAFQSYHFDASERFMIGSFSLLEIVIAVLGLRADSTTRFKQR